MGIQDILSKEFFSKEDLTALLETTGTDTKELFNKALEIKTQYVGRKVYFRGLIEYSNYCRKNCFYCGIRAGNKRYRRYELTDQEVLEAAKYAWENDFASIVIQSGERSDRDFVSKIGSLLKGIQKMTGNKLHITLSLGEQTEETYREWFSAGARRYLLRIEVSNPGLYKRLHPSDKQHDYNTRLEALKMLRDIGFQVGTGVMIGLPFQTISDLADDLLFFRDHDIDMAGMGPYIEHEDTPLYKYRDQLPGLQERLQLSLKMVAILRIMMKDINIAATTAMQSIDPKGREKALLAGANVMMPNLTPLKYKQNYLLYKNKPGIEDDAEETRATMEQNIFCAGDTIGYGEWGDPVHFKKRKS